MTPSISKLSALHLAETLASAPPLALKGPELLKRLRAEGPQGQDQWLPVSPRDCEEIAAATTEMIHLMNDSQRLAQLLGNLDPIPLATIEIVEFPI